MRVKACKMPDKKIVLDLWNQKENTGYEIHISITRDLKKALKIAMCYVGQTHSIVAWDELITCIKADLIEER